MLLNQIMAPAGFYKHAIFQMTETVKNDWKNGLLIPSLISWENCSTKRLTDFIIFSFFTRALHRFSVALSVRRWEFNY